MDEDFIFYNDSISLFSLAEINNNFGDYFTNSLKIFQIDSHLIINKPKFNDK